MEDRSDTNTEAYAGSSLESSDTALLETLILEAPVAFAFYDTTLRYRRINRILAEINGIPMRDHIGRLPSEVLPPALGSAVEARLREVFATGQVVKDRDFTSISPTTGDVRHYESQWFPAPGTDGTVVGVAVMVLDVTDRRRIEDALLRSTERTAKLQRATAALSEALTVDDVRRTVEQIGRSSLGAIQIEIEIGEHRRPAGDSPEDDAGHVLVLPLAVSGGQIGRLRIVLSDPVGKEESIFLAALAGQCAIALERARLYERERATAATLQRSLLPDRLLEAPGLELAARFRAGSPDAEVGGDWYDVFGLPDGRLIMVVGDVMGKGVNAAAGMGRLRSALRALAHANPLPEAVLQGLDRVFSATEGEEQIATLVYLLVNPETRRAAIGGAGHLPLVLRRAGQAPELVDAGSGSTPLGWPETRRQRTLELGPGDLVLAFTDGLVERRGYDIDQGLAAVQDLVRDPSGTLDDLVDRVSSSLMADTLGRDDATVLAVRFTD